MTRMFAIAVAVMLSAFIFAANSAPMNGAEFSFKQPDGSLVPVRVWGDEFHQDVESLEGSKIRNAELSVYDAAGSFINRIRIIDNGDSNNARRQVGLWDLTDLSGRLVPSGSYIIRGSVISSDGESKNISIVVGVN